MSCTQWPSVCRIKERCTGEKSEQGSKQGARCSDFFLALARYQRRMLFFIWYDELSYIYEPHGTQDEAWSTTLEGSVMLKASDRLRCTG